MSVTWESQRYFGFSLVQISVHHEVSKTTPFQEVRKTFPKDLKGNKEKGALAGWPLGTLCPCTPADSRGPCLAHGWVCHAEGSNRGFKAGGLSQGPRFSCGDRTSICNPIEAYSSTGTSRDSRITGIVGRMIFMITVLSHCSSRSWPHPLIIMHSLQPFWQPW